MLDAVSSPLLSADSLGASLRHKRAALFGKTSLRFNVGSKRRKIQEKAAKVSTRGALGTALGTAEGWPCNCSGAKAAQPLALACAQAGARGWGTPSAISACCGPPQVCAAG